MDQQYRHRIFEDRGCISVLGIKYCHPVPYIFHTLMRYVPLSKNLLYSTVDGYKIMLLPNYSRENDKMI
jgi:hypothetical protein